LGWGGEGVSELRVNENGQHACAQDQSQSTAQFGIKQFLILSHSEDLLYMDSPILQVEQLNKIVHDVSGDLHILRDIEMTLNRGDSLAIVGSSGSGKSTLLAIMAGLDTPSSGRVRLMGEDFSALSEDARAQKRAGCMGFVFQSFQLLSHLSALENVQLPLELMGHPEPKRQALEMLDRVGLASKVKQLPKVLSGGEQQRVALARAFAAEPKVLLADEPTGSLDKATGELILSLMLELQKENGSTLVLVTHDLGLASQMNQRIHLEGGCMV
jgi:putative ABC transport system ATP-binding protein